VEGNRIVLVWGCTESGRKENCVGLGMYRKWKKIEFLKSIEHEFGNNKNER
jgi:hypothetical protein